MGFADELKGKAENLLHSVQERFESGAEPTDDQVQEPVEEPVDEPVDEPVEDFAAAGDAPPETVYDRRAAVEEAAAELQRHNQPDQL